MHEARALQHIQMFGNRGTRHRERLGQLTYGGVGVDEATENGTSGGVGEGGKHAIESIGITGNHMVTSMPTLIVLRKCTRQTAVNMGSACKYTVPNLYVGSTEPGRQPTLECDSAGIYASAQPGEFDAPIIFPLFPTIMFAPRYHILAVFVTLAACSGTDSRSAASSATDVLTIATPADADALIPQLVQSTQGKQATDMLFDYLAQPTSTLETVGDAGFKPSLASSWAWSSDSLSIAFTLNSKARWHDGQPVRAADVKFSYALYVDPAIASPHASNFEGIDSVSVRDSLTAVVWWKRRNPEQFYQIATSLAIVPEHLLASEPRATLAQSAYAQHPVGSGRYRFEQWARDRQLMLTADSTNFRGRPTFKRVVWIVSADPTAASLSVLSGQADVLESVRGDAFVNARKSTKVRTVEYGSLDYAFMVLNSERTVGGNRRLFGDRAMRVALTAALNRPAMVSNALDSLGAVALGPFTRSATGVDTAMRQIAFDAARAGLTLDSLGWKTDAVDKLRKKNGKALRFELLVPTASATRLKFGVLIQAQLASMGVTVDLAPLDQGMFVSRLEKGDFDAALNMWRTDPSPVAGLRQVWASPHGQEIGANYGRYSSKSFDAIVDSAAVEFSAAKRQALFRKAYQLIVEDAAGIWLYEPRNFAAINSRIEPTGMRAYAWWADLADWNVTSARVANAPANTAANAKP